MVATPSKQRQATRDDNLKMREKASITLQEAIEKHVNEFTLEGSKPGDHHVPRLQALLNAVDNLIPDLWRKINNSHLSNSLVHDMFLTSMRVENEAKQALLVSIAAKEKDSETKIDLYTLVKTYSINVEDVSTKYDKYIERAQISNSTQQKHGFSVSKLERQCNQLITEIGLPEAVNNRYDLINTDFAPVPIENKDATSLRDKINHALFAREKLYITQRELKHDYDLKKLDFTASFTRSNNFENLDLNQFSVLVVPTPAYQDALKAELGSELSKVRSFDESVKNAGKYICELLAEHDEKRKRFLDFERQWVIARDADISTNSSSKKRKKSTQLRTPRSDAGGDDSPDEF